MVACNHDKRCRNQTPFIPPAHRSHAFAPPPHIYDNTYVLAAHSPKLAPSPPTSAQGKQPATPPGALPVLAPAPPGEGADKGNPARKQGRHIVCQLIGCLPSTPPFLVPCRPFIAPIRPFLRSRPPSRPPARPPAAALLLSLARVVARRAPLLLQQPLMPGSPQVRQEERVGSGGCLWCDLLPRPHHASSRPPDSADLQPCAIA